MKLLPLLFLFGCAAIKQDLKPFPQQSADCLKAEGNASNAVKAAQCLAQGTTQAAQACWLSLSEGLGLDYLQCEAVALWQDVHHAQVAAVALGVPTSTVQLNAVTYLQATDPAASHP